MSNIPKFVERRGQKFTQSSEKKGIIPKYVLLNDSIPLMYDLDSFLYRSATEPKFCLRFKMEDGKVIAISCIGEYDAKILKPVTKEEWMKWKTK